MKIFYCGAATSLLPLLAGAIHLGNLSQECVPLDAVIKLVRETGCGERKQWGIPLLMGVDFQGIEIYRLTLGPDPDIGLQAIYHLLNTVGDPTQWKFYKTSNNINMLTRWGLFCIWHLHLVRLGRWLIAWGIRKVYFDLVNQVQQVKERNQVGKTESGCNY